jgi:hypothetical protein
VWTSGVGSSEPIDRPSRPVWSWTTSKSSCRAKQFSACWSSQNVWPIRSLGASSKTAASLARVLESPEAKRVTSWPASASASASSETIHSIPP